MSLTPTASVRIAGDGQSSQPGTPRKLLQQPAVATPLPDQRQTPQQSAAQSRISNLVRKIEAEFGTSGPELVHDACEKFEHALVHLLLASGWIRDLTKEGVEPNPGPGVRSNPLDKLARSGDLSEDGKNFLIQSLDPFHDYDIDPIGVPDVDGSSTVAVCLQQSFTVSAPASGVNGYVSGANYDAHVFTLPELTTNAYASWNSADNQALVVGTSSTSATPITLNPVNAVTMPTGANTFPNFRNVGATTTYNTITGVGSGGWDIGISRLVSMGIEIVNTTADISLQGSVSVYRSPQADQFCQVTALANQLTPSGISTCIATCSKLPPNNIGEVMLMPGTKQWRANEGAYLVAVPWKKENPLQDQTVMGKQFLYPQGYQIAAPGRVGFQNFNYAVAQNQGSSAPTNIQWLGANQSAKSTPFDTVGAYFVGLSSATTLQVNVRMYFEKAPVPEDTQLALLARRSPKYDALAMELYSAAIGMLPPGVKLSENPAGEWFQRCLTAIRDNSPWVGTVLQNAGVPWGTMAGGVIANLARMGLGNKPNKKSTATKDSVPAVHKVTTLSNNPMVQASKKPLSKAQKKALKAAGLPYS